MQNVFLQEKKGKEKIKSLSLNDLLLHATEGNHKATKNDVKRTKRSMSEPSDSFSPEVQCNVGVIFEFHFSVFLEILFTFLVSIICFHFPLMLSFTRNKSFASHING